MKRRGRRRWTLTVGLLLLGVWLLNVSRPGTQAVGCPVGCAAVQPPGEGPLRVLSLNMLHGFPRFERLPERLVLIAHEIGRLDPDIVGLAPADLEGLVRDYIPLILR